MNAGKIVIAASCCFICALVQFMAATLGVPFALACGLVVGLLTGAALQFFRLELGAVWLILLATAASLAGIVPVLVGRTSSSIGLLFSPLVALGTAGMLAMVLRGRRGRCGLCNRRFGEDVRFRCPRCHLEVCDRECWDFDNLRCRLCQQNCVPVFSADPRWWNEHLGPRLTQGRCQLCMSSPAEGDLRACPKCSRPQCRACWDIANGRCQHCRWVIPDLPPRLQVYMAQPSAGVASPTKAVKLVR